MDLAVALASVTLVCGFFVGWYVRGIRRQIQAAPPIVAPMTPLPRTRSFGG